jgi:hypothetical protein
MKTDTLLARGTFADWLYTRTGVKANSVSGRKIMREFLSGRGVRLSAAEEKFGNITRRTVKVTFFK